ncbi:hypothetical protein M2326_003172 [Flavobacterium sp. 7A]|nr:hypothetical protein [Flavobacterium sp. 7A]
MSEKYKVIDSTVPTFMTMTIVDWVEVFPAPFIVLFWMNL